MNVELSQEQSPVYLTCIVGCRAGTSPSRNRQFRHRSSKSHPELGDSRTRVVRCASVTTHHLDAIAKKRRSLSDRISGGGEMGAVLAAWCRPSAVVSFEKNGSVTSVSPQVSGSLDIPNLKYPGWKRELSGPRPLPGTRNNTNLGDWHPLRPRKISLSHRKSLTVGARYVFCLSTLCCAHRACLVLYSRDITLSTVCQNIPYNLSSPSGSESSIQGSHNRTTIGSGSFSSLRTHHGFCYDIQVSIEAHQLTTRLPEGWSGGHLRARALIFRVTKNLLMALTMPR